MDHLRVLLVPFHADQPDAWSAIFARAAHAVLPVGGLLRVVRGSLFLQIWVFKYCYVLIEHLADGAREPPVMSTDMLSPFEIRPWVQLGIVIGGPGCCCMRSAAPPASRSACVLLALLPASIAVLGVGEPFYQAVNPADCCGA